MGFETYPELFDESYDDEVNIDNRFNMVVKEIKRYIDMWNKNKSKVHQIFTQENILEKRKHNQNWVIYHNPVLPDLYYKLGRIYYYQGRFDDAEKTFKKIIGIDSNNYNSHYKLGELHYLQNNKEIRIVVIFVL